MPPLNDQIRLRGVRQNNLKNLDLDLPLGALIVVTGVSGSGKSSLAFDTVYAEGQRRYVETFSPYARQFLDRMDRPQAERIDGIPPAIAIDQTNPVRTSRSTVGTMTELSDHLKLLFARAARLFCHGCGREVRRDSPEGIWAALAHRQTATRALVCFELAIPDGLTSDQLKELLAQQGYIRFLHEDDQRLEVIQDRLRLDDDNRGRALEALEAALEHGGGRVRIYPLDAERNPGPPWHFSRDLHCPECEIDYRDPLPSLFSFNSPVGACETCRGFGRVIGIDWDLVVPDARKSLLDGAIKPIQSDGYAEVQEDLIAFAHRRGVPTDVPWAQLTEADRHWVLEGEGDWHDDPRLRVWYGIRGFLDWLEGRSYKMHVRVLLSRYRSYDPCPDCGGARLKDAALDFRIGDHALADAVLERQQRFRHARSHLSETAWLGLPGLNIQDLTRLPIASLARFFDALRLPGNLDQAMELLLANIRARLHYLTEVGLGYLTLERQSRTLSGGEVQRINLTTALGTALVNTLFVLDEPSIGLHPRDMDRVVRILQRLRDRGNTLLVVEHDPQVMRAADQILDIGPGPGERGGQRVFQGPPAALLDEPASLTGDFLAGRRLVAEPRAPRPPRPGEPKLRIRGAREHNLKHIDLELPLQRLVVITGVSGSGKSTLVQQVLFHHLAKQKGHPEGPLGACDAVEGVALIEDVLMVDQSPIGRSSRSNPASYVGALDPLRKLFAAAPLARERGFKAGHFSFNAGPGRCPTCAGSGFEHVEMQFLSDVYLRCPDCNGQRYRPEILEVRLPAQVSRSAEAKGSGQNDATPPSEPRAEPATGPNIAEVLAMTVAEALAAFADQADLRRALQPLVDVGLDYLRLGQPVPTLSGGEAQRLKLAGHLAKTARRRPTRTVQRKHARTDEGKVSGEVQDQQGQDRPHQDQPGLLFLFDEPTTGLHFADIATLLGAFRRLIDAGHSLLVIEHNVDLMLAADWIVDLGPEGGDGGGEIIACGTPRMLAEHPESHTGRALREALAPNAALGTDRAPTTAAEIAEVSADYRSKFAATDSTIAGPIDGNAEQAILIRHAREHNLKDLILSIPRGQFIVITGVSGSGKSTLAFDILFAEGQRRYLESLNAYARQFVQPAARADVDAIFGIPPTVAIEQRSSRGGRKSTVGTATEIHHFLRLLYVKLGLQHCPACQVPIQPQGRAEILSRIREDFHGQRLILLAPLVIARKGTYAELADWAKRRGVEQLAVDGELQSVEPWPKLDRFRDHWIDLPFPSVAVDGSHQHRLSEQLDQALAIGKGLVRVVVAEQLKPSLGQAAGQASPRTYSTQRTCPSCGLGFDEPDPRLFSYNSKHGWCPTCFGTGLQLKGFDAEQSGEEGQWLANDGDLDSKSKGASASPAKACPSCQGRRLRPEALAVTFRARSIAELSALSVTDASQLFAELNLSEREAAIGRDLLSEVRARLGFLERLGLGYLSLDRAAPTLSGGEAQRIRLAAQLGSNLRGVCYILDEPSIGLHARDNARLLETLAELKAKGNSLIVVEHDAATMHCADEIIDLGPGAGIHGGEIVARGTAEALAANPASLTGRYLARNRVRSPQHATLATRSTPDSAAAANPAADTQFALAHAVTASATDWLHIEGASLHNLQDLSLGIPLARLVCVTGVSGSGKSTLVRDVLGASLKTLLSPDRDGGHRARKAELSGCGALRGWQALSRVLEVDQTPIGKTPRSCPATYIGIWDRIRRLFAAAPEARMLGWGPGRFSFNTGGGRCPACEGQGVQRLEMSFLPDVKLPCEVCGGTRFNAETRRIPYLGKDIGAVLAMSVDEAVELFQAHPAIRHPLELLQAVGLGYLALGQASPTLSGGEAQRLKLVTELAKARPTADGPSNRSTLYLLDEPTVGLHMADTERLIGVLRRLVAAGHSVVVIEHDLDLIAAADWVIDLGPEAGRDGGRLVATGSPAELMTQGIGHTADAIRQHASV
ncbi:excinuclease ABC subunit UvrA [Halochromatium salexigens]|uniref:UvrABC system protein A n=1 Tax=Halochromatium salexigens TaxID=49447 RepID=A0AAJ0XEU3_HALSE|nr:excinuclease ABC subunit UvrA [Halochromatium salexigens]MBK5930269.1 excinuclease ABC subunit A [Halochromatium salexigens]